MKEDQGNHLKVMLVSFVVLLLTAVFGFYWLLIRPPAGEFSADILGALSHDAVLMLRDGNASIKTPDGLSPYGKYSKEQDGWVLFMGTDTNETPWLIERTLDGFYLVDGTNTTIRYKFVRSWLPNL